MFFATQPIEEPESLADMALLLQLFDGENNVVFASDWPHHDFELAGIFRGGIDGGFQIELGERPFAHERAQSPERKADLPARPACATSCAGCAHRPRGRN